MSSPGRIDFVAVSENYAIRERDLGSIRDRFIKPTTERGVAAQTAVLALAPEFSAVSITMGTAYRKDFVTFFEPENWLSQRTFSHYPAPSLGSQEELGANMRSVSGFIAQNEARFSAVTAVELKREGASIEKGIQELINTNQLSDQLTAMLLSFLQS